MTIAMDSIPVLVTVPMAWPDSCENEIDIFLKNNEIILKRVRFSEEKVFCDKKPLSLEEGDVQAQWYNRRELKTIAKENQILVKYRTRTLPVRDVCTRGLESAGVLLKGRTVRRYREAVIEEQREQEKKGIQDEVRLRSVARKYSKGSRLRALEIGKSDANEVRHNNEKKDENSITDRSTALDLDTSHTKVRLSTPVKLRIDCKKKTIYLE